MGKTYKLRKKKPFVKEKESVPSEHVVMPSRMQAKKLRHRTRQELKKIVDI